MLGLSMSISSSRKEPSNEREGGVSAATSLRGSELVPSVLGKLGEVGTLDGLGRKRVKEQRERR